LPSADSAWEDRDLRHVPSRRLRAGLLVFAGAFAGAGIAIGIVYAADINGGSSTPARSGAAGQNTGLAAPRISVNGLLPRAKSADPGPHDCRQWNIAYWNSHAVFAQSNNYHVHFDFYQTYGTRLEGPARATDVFDRKVFFTGTVQGNLNPSALLPGEERYGALGRRADAFIYFTIRWSNGAVGVYSGRITRTGWGDGTTWDVRNPRSTATWVLHANPRCD
jgi:hypothetical protein